MELDGKFMRRTTGERKTIKAIWKCYFCEEMVVNLHLLAWQTFLKLSGVLEKREFMAAPLMHFSILSVLYEMRSQYQYREPEKKIKKIKLNYRIFDYI